MNPEPGVSPFPWDEVLGFVLGRLRWTPETAWRATPREIVAALGPPAQSLVPLLGRDLAALMRSYPDRQPGD
ncbi:phage tail assembly chaperone [uncultured Enterovirga sp.]|uniref:phage tail assembly chaperone n=1 Tax=uncultured Enterovirga sp. TaxID=2026352 RepID=UPI0035CAC24B